MTSKTFSRRKVLAAIALCPALTIAQEPSPAKPQRLQFRLAYEQHADGRIEATVHGEDKKLYLAANAVVTQDDVARVSFAPDSNGNMAVTIDFLPACYDRLSSSTKSHVGKPLAIVLDDIAIYAPIVNFQISRSAQICGPFSDDVLLQLFNALVLKLPPIRTAVSN